jgi:hypothetical protein
MWPFEQGGYDLLRPSRGEPLYQEFWEAWKVVAKANGEVELQDADGTNVQSFFAKANWTKAAMVHDAHTFPEYDINKLMKTNRTKGAEFMDLFVRYVAQADAAKWKWGAKGAVVAAGSLLSSKTPPPGWIDDGAAFLGFRANWQDAGYGPVPFRMPLTFGSSSRPIPWNLGRAQIY